MRTVTANAQFTADDIEFWNHALQHKGRMSDQPDVIDKKTANFGGGVEVDIKLCNTDGTDDNNAGDASTPYLDIVLFIDGCEAGCLEPRFFAIDNGYEFDFGEVDDCNCRAVAKVEVV